MQSTDLEEIKAALWEQTFLGCTLVRCPMGQVMAISKEEGTTPGSPSWVGALVSDFGGDR